MAKVDLEVTLTVAQRRMTGTLLLVAWFAFTNPNAQRAYVAGWAECQLGDRVGTLDNSKGYQLQQAAGFYEAGCCTGSEEPTGGLAADDKYMNSLSYDTQQAVLRILNGFDRCARKRR